MMENSGFIEIRISGSMGNLELSPDTYDIREVIAILENAENLLFPNDKKERPPISYKIEEGSVRRIFKTSLQYIIGFNAVIGKVAETKNIDFLDLPSAKAFENIQEIATKKDYTFQIFTSVENSKEVKIDRSTHFYRTENVWVEAEFYLYGKVTNAGGKDKANIHIYTEELGTVRIETPISFLEAYEDNLLYKTFGIRAVGKQHTKTGEIDKSSLKFLELLDYEQIYDEKYLKSLRDKAKKSWIGNIDADKWLIEIRGRLNR
jgi:hypothetical protein